MYTILLIIHLLCAMFWLGGAVYERIYVAGSLKRTRGTEKETELTRILLSTESVFLPATLLLLISGIIMTILSGAGFYTLNWLGFKQMVMTVIFIIFALYVGPKMKTIKKSFHEVLEGKRAISDEDRGRVGSLLRAFDIIHLGVLLNVLLAVWKPM